jgi:hypothetical protein
MSIPELATLIEHRFRAQRRNPFPYDEVETLIRRHCTTEQIVVDLDIFHSAIDGYADSARALAVSDEEKLLKARRDLSRSFFDIFPRNKPCQDLITENDTPRLFARMRVAEDLRRELLSMLDRLLG